MKYVLLLILCCPTIFLYGQQTTSIPVIVASADQAPISLKVDDLKVEVKGQAVTVMSVSPLAGERLRYLLLNDQSGSTRWPNGIKQQTQVALQFLKQVVTSGSDLGGLVNFADDVYFDVQNSRNPDEIAARLKPEGRGVTRMYDAVVSSANWLAKQASGLDQRKVVFLFCDGEDRGSKTNFEEATEALQRGRIPMFIVAPSSVEGKKDGAILRQLAGDSGGRAYFLPRDTRQINLDFIKRDLGQSFRLTLDVPSSLQGRLPLTIRDIENPQISIVAPAQVVLP